MIQRVVIFGGHIQALGIARQVKARGLEVIIVTNDRFSIARFSHVVDRTIIAQITEWNLRIEELNLPNRGTMLFPTNDEAVEMLCERYEEYHERFVLGVPKQETITLFNDKRKAYQFAASHQVSCPKCWYPNTMDEVKEMSETLPYPVVVKPAIMYSFHATFGKKAFRCDDATSLVDVYEKIAAKHYPLETLLIQEFLDGGAKNLYSCGVMALEGEIAVSMQAHRIRQNPMDFGNSTTYAISCYMPEIQEQTKALLQMTKYSGVGEIEWMWDAKEGRYKFLEINTRAWKWHTISNQLGFSFVGALIDTYNGVVTAERVNELGNEEAKELTSEEVAWSERLTDFTIAAKEILHRRMTLKEVIASYKIKHESAVWSWQDPLPAVMYILLSPILYIKRH